MINALIAINSNQVQNFLDNFRADENGRIRTDFAAGTPGNVFFIDPYDTRYLTVIDNNQGLWKENTSGPQPFTLVTIYVADLVEPDWTDPQDPDPGPVLTVLHYLREAFPGGLVVLDVFQRNGLRHGQSFDTDGTTVIGQPTYPSIPKAEMLLYTPDDVTYDADGNETSRTPATDYKEVNKLAGWADRRYE